VSISSDDDTDYTELDDEYDLESDSDVDMRMEDKVDAPDGVESDGDVDMERVGDDEDKEDEDEEDEKVEEDEDKDEDVDENECNGPGRVLVILVTKCYIKKQDKRLDMCFEEIRTRQESTLVQSRNLLCYTREPGKRDEKDILQRKQHSLYIQFICHPGTIPHAPMYHPNLIS
jgi:hypothetical protein